MGTPSRVVFLPGQRWIAKETLRFEFMNETRWVMRYAGMPNRKRKRKGPHNEIFKMLRIARRERVGTDMQMRKRGLSERFHEQRRGLNRAIFLGGNLLQFVPPTTSSYLHRARERAREGAGWSHGAIHSSVVSSTSNLITAGRGRTRTMGCVHGCFQGLCVTSSKFCVCKLRRQQDYCVSSSLYQTQCKIEK